MKSQFYMTRAMRARDPRYATILSKLGYTRADTVAETPKGSKAQPQATSTSEAPADALHALRQQYQEVVGKRPFNGWDAEKLQAKIAEAKASK